MKFPKIRKYIIILMILSIGVQPSLSQAAGEQVADGQVECSEVTQRVVYCFIATAYVCQWVSAGYLFKICNDCGNCDPLMKKALASGLLRAIPLSMWLCGGLGDNDDTAKCALVLNLAAIITGHVLGFYVDANILKNKTNNNFSPLVGSAHSSLIAETLPYGGVVLWCTILGARELWRCSPQIRPEISRVAGNFCSTFGQMCQGVGQNIKSALSRISFGRQHLEPVAIAVIPDLETPEAEGLSQEQPQTCSICLDKSISVVYCPCGHATNCSECSEVVDQCPICRDPIQSKIKVLWPGDSLFCSHCRGKPSNFIFVQCGHLANYKVEKGAERCCTCIFPGYGLQIFIAGSSLGENEENLERQDRAVGNAAIVNIPPSMDNED